MSIPRTSFSSSPVSYFSIKDTPDGDGDQVHVRPAHPHLPARILDRAAVITTNSTLSTSDFLRIVDAMYGEDPTLSMVHVAKELEVGYTTVAQAIKDLGMRSYVRRVRALISAKAKVILIFSLILRAVTWVRGFVKCFLRIPQLFCPLRKLFYLLPK